MNGRLLKDSDKVIDLKLDSKSSIQAFISPNMNPDKGKSAKIKLSDSDDDIRQKTDSSEDQSQDIKEKTSDLEGGNMQDIMGDSRGFDFFKLNGYTVILKFLEKSKILG